MKFHIQNQTEYRWQTNLKYILLIGIQDECVLDLGYRSRGDG